MSDGEMLLAPMARLLKESDAEFRAKHPEIFDRVDAVKREPEWIPWWDRDRWHADRGDDGRWTAEPSD